MKQLGLSISSAGDILAVAPFYQSSVRGVFAAGDCITPLKSASAAIASGCNARVASAAQLQMEKYGLQPMF